MKEIIILAILALFLMSCASNAPQGQGTTEPNTNTIPQQDEPVPEEPSKEVPKEVQTTPVEQPTAEVPSTVKEFRITAKQFEFDPPAIEVNKGDKVRLIITSADVPHGFSIPEYKINE